jgi:hypothetical protein
MAEAETIELKLPELNIEQSRGLKTNQRSTTTKYLN